MKKQVLSLLVTSFFSVSGFAQSTYFFPRASFDPSIPSPEEFLGPNNSAPSS